MSKIADRIFKSFLIVGIILLGYLFYVNKVSQDFYINYLSVYSFFISASIGAAFLILLMHLTRGGWGIVVKRVPEHLMSLLPIFALLFIPLLFGLEHVYEWLDADVIAKDYLIQQETSIFESYVFYHKKYFLFYSIFSNWILLLEKFNKKQDTAKKEEAIQITKSLQRKSPVALLLMSLATSFASFDWLMSLYPHWFSTIFGIYYFAGAVVFCLAITIIIYEILKDVGLLKDYPNTLSIFMIYQSYYMDSLYFGHMYRSHNIF